MNHAIYLQLFEEARWEWATFNGYGLDKMIRLEQGPVVLDVHIRYKKEVRLREHLRIDSVCESFRKRLAVVKHSMINEQGEVCCVAKVTLALFDKKSRALISPTPEFLCGIGLEDAVKSLDSGVEKIDSNITS